MNESEIQIGIACGENCEHYVNFLVDSIRSTSSGDYDIKFIFGVNRKCVDIKELIRVNDDFKIEVVYAIEENTIPSSGGHGRTLNVILQSMNSEYGMFVDCDCAFLKKNWDSILIDLLDDKVVIVGSEYDGLKYMKFPNIVGCIFKTSILKDLGVSLLPLNPSDPPKGLITIDEKNSSIYSRQIGERIMLDVGWQMCYKLKVNGYDGLHLLFVRTQNQQGTVKCDYSSKFIVGNMRGEEYQLDGEPIFTHIGRSSSRDFMRDEIIIKWCDRTKEWLSSHD